MKAEIAGAEKNLADAIQGFMLALQVHQLHVSEQQAEQLRAMQMQGFSSQSQESQGTEPWALPYAELRFKTNGRVPKEMLGIGGFGQVFLADFKGKQVEVKEPLNPTLLTSIPKLHQAFCREVTLFYRL